MKIIRENRLNSASPRMTAMAAVAVISFLCLLVTGPAFAAKKSKSIKTEATFVGYDAEAKTLEVKVKKKGKKPANKALKLKTGKKATFKVKPEGSVMTRTSVTLDGKRADIDEIRPGQFLFIYWVPDEADDSIRFARKIDLVLSDEELDARNKARLDAARAAGQLSD